MPSANDNFLSPLRGQSGVTSMSCDVGPSTPTPSCHPYRLVRGGPRPLPTTTLPPRRIQKPRIRPTDEQGAITSVHPSSSSNNLNAHPKPSVLDPLPSSPPYRLRVRLRCECARQRRAMRTGSEHGARKEPLVSPSITSSENLVVMHDARLWRKRSPSYSVLNNITLTVTVR